MKTIRKSLENFSGASLMTRLSLIILGHTALTFLGAWALFSFPELGEGEADLSRQDSMISKQASQAAQALAQMSQNQSASGHGKLLRELFSATVESLPEIRHQAVYRIGANGAVSMILDWEDDLKSGVRSLSVIRKSEQTVATSLQQNTPGTVLRVTSEVDGHHWATCYSSALIPSSEQTGELCVYQVTIATTPPPLFGFNFKASLIAFLFTSLLIALLIIQLLNSKLSMPLKRLQKAFYELTNNEQQPEAPVLVEKCAGCALSPVIDAFNRMSTTLFFQHADLLLAHDQIKNAAAELSDSKTLLETVVESSPDAIIVCDLHGEIMFFNRAGREQFGYGEDEPAPTALSELFVSSAETDNLHQKPLQPTRSERLGVKLDGSQFPTLVMSAPLRYDGATTNAALFVIRDISESQSYKEMMVRLDRSAIRGEMAGDVAHEINNYLAILQGNTELLPILISKGDTDKIEKRIGILGETITRVATFTEGLMNFESQESDFTEDCPNQLIHNLLAFLKPQKRLGSVEIKLDLDSRITVAQYSEGQIQQALVNLIYNAADALGESKPENGAVINISSRITADSLLQISVSDNGPGVSPQAREALFKERFTTKRKGHGIGLITIARIAEAHNGEIRYEDSPSGGASFVLEIPLRQPEPETVIYSNDQDKHADF